MAPRPDRSPQERAGSAAPATYLYPVGKLAPWASLLADHSHPAAPARPRTVPIHLPTHPVTAMVQAPPHVPVAALARPAAVKLTASEIHRRRAVVQRVRSPKSRVKVHTLLARSRAAVVPAEITLGKPALSCHPQPAAIHQPKHRATRHAAKAQHAKADKPRAGVAAVACPQLPAHRTQPVPTAASAIPLHLTPRVAETAAPKAAAQATKHPSVSSGTKHATTRKGAEHAVPRKPHRVKQLRLTRRSARH